MNRNKNKNMAKTQNLPSKRKRSGSPTDSMNDSDSDAEVRKQVGSWPSWLLIDAADESKPLSGLSPFAIAKGIKGLSGEPKSIKKLRNGSLLVECATQMHSHMLMKSKSLIDRPIRVSPHRTLNSSKGVIRCRDLRGVSEAEMKTELASQGVTDVYRVLVRKGEERVPTDTFFLTFCKTTLPRSIKVGYLQVTVSLYVPSPLRCFKCQKFGHVRDRCKEEEKCGVCSKAVHGGECNSPAFCANCGGNHPSSSKNCPSWNKEKEIQRIRTEQRIPFFEAKKIFEAQQPRQGMSYASVVKSTASVCVQTVSVGTQTLAMDTNIQVKTTAPSTKLVKLAASGGGVVSASPQPGRRSSSTAGQDMGPPPVPPKPSGGRRSTTTVGVVKVADKAATPKPPRSPKGQSGSRSAAGHKKSPLRAKGSDVRSEPPPKKDEVSTSNKYTVLSNQENVEME
eukprot:TRINITY_DN619_c0_g2_i1.p1 TRINITY_DN619_c0_g2~~TRINITY_DN619_c0_g2_i1.p1  ORF type:complete len:451 (-),score=53.34 TRINITY_DN619_c0_g2_i1:176-1528(-)